MSYLDTNNCIGGATPQFVSLLAGRFGIAVMSATEFYEQFSLVGLKDISGSKGSYSISPVILYHNQHFYLGYDPRHKWRRVAIEDMIAPLPVGDLTGPTVVIKRVKKGKPAPQSGQAQKPAPADPNFKIAEYAHQLPEHDKQCSCALLMAYWAVTRKYTKEFSPPMLCRASAQIFISCFPKRFSGYFDKTPLHQEVTLTHEHRLKSCCFGIEVLKG